jgi:hypothetical protein
LLVFGADWWEEPAMKLGINLIANGRNVGRQAAKIAMLSSRYDQVAASVLFQVGSVTFVAVLSAERRTMEIMQVLEFLASCGSRGAAENLQKAEAENGHEHDLLSSG